MGNKKKFLNIQLPSFAKGLFRYRNGGLPLVMMAGMLFWAGLFSTLTLLRIGLLFTVSDMEIEARQLQDQVMHQKQVRDQLRLDIERYQEGSRLLEAAHDELEMVSVDLTEIERMTMSEALIQKYDSARVRDGNSGKSIDPEQEGLSTMLAALSFLD